MLTPKVSVLIPTYNYAHILDETIKSVLDQTFQDFELIVVDDGSKDNTDEVMEKYKTDPRITYLRNEKNLGLVDNWNKCLDLAKGEYIKYLCADDRFKPTILEKFVAVMDAYPKVSLVTCNKEIFGKSSVIVELPLTHYQDGYKVIKHTLNNFGWLGEPTCLMFRRSDVAKVGKFKKGLVWLPDWEMWLRLLTVGDCYLVPEDLAYVQNHSNQLTKKVMRSYINIFEEYELARDIRNKNGYSMDISDDEMKRVVKRRAEAVGKVMYKTLPHIYDKKARKTFFKSLGIAFRERVIFKTLLKLISPGKPGPKILKERPAF